MLFYLRLVCSHIFIFYKKEYQIYILKNGDEKKNKKIYQINLVLKFL